MHYLFPKQMGSGCAGISSHGKLLETTSVPMQLSKLSSERSAVSKQSERTVKYFSQNWICQINKLCASDHPKNKLLRPCININRIWGIVLLPRLKGDSYF